MASESVIRLTNEEYLKLKKNLSKYDKKAEDIQTFISLMIRHTRYITKHLTYKIIMET